MSVYDDQYRIKYPTTTRIWEGGVQFLIAIVNDVLAFHSGRAVFHVSCLSCGVVIHPKTTGPDFNVTMHLKECHPAMTPLPIQTAVSILASTLRNTIVANQVVLKTIIDRPEDNEWRIEVRIAVRGQPREFADISQCKSIGGVLHVASTHYSGSLRESEDLELRAVVLAALASLMRVAQAALRA